MAKNIRQPEWRNSHEFTNYPFAPTATLQNEAGQAILTGTFLDASLYPVGAVAGLYISKIAVVGSGITVVIGDEQNTNLASAYFELAAPPSVLRFQDAYSRPAGVLVSEPERLSLFAGWPVGEHTFLPEETTFVARCCVPAAAVGFRGFELEDGSVLTDDIFLVADSGVVLTAELTSLPATPDTAEQLVNTLRVDVIGDSLFRRKLCADDEAFETPRLLQKLHIGAPTATGNSASPDFEANDDVDILCLLDSSWPTSARFWLQVKILLPDVLELLYSRLPNLSARWAMADYKDFEDGGLYETDGFVVRQPFTTNQAAFLEAWKTIPFVTSADLPQQQLFSLKQAAENWVGTKLQGRPDAKKIIFWVGSSPGWVNGEKGYSYPTLEQVGTALTNANVQLVVFNWFHPGEGLDTDLQASTLVNATSGLMLDSFVDTDAWERLQSTIFWLTDAFQTLITGEEAEPWSRPQIDIDCLPNLYGNVSLTAGSLSVSDTVLRVRPTTTGLIIETVGEPLGDLR